MRGLLAHGTLRPMPQLPPELGHKVSTRTHLWSEYTDAALGADANRPDKGVYSFGGGKRQFDSTDLGARSGIYAVEPYDYIMQSDNYPDMRTEIQGRVSGDGPIHGTDIVRDV